MIIFLFGQDNFRSRQKLKELSQKFIKEIDPSGSSLTVLNGETVTMAQIGEAVSPGTLLAKKRLIVVEEIFTNKSPVIFTDLLKYLKSKKLDNTGGAGDNIVIFRDTTVKTKKTRSGEEVLKVDSAGRDKALAGSALELFNYLAGQKYAQQFKKYSNSEASTWLQQEVSFKGGIISHQAASLLISLTGGDLWQVSNEINKLIGYQSARQPKLTSDGQPVAIDIEAIEQLVRGSFDENIFVLTDAIGNKNKALAVKLLEEQIEAGLTDSYLLAMITRQFKILLRVRQALDLGDSPRKIISGLKLHPFVVQKTVNQVRRFNLAELKKLLSQLIRIDYLMKSGAADIKIMLDLLIARI